MGLLYIDATHGATLNSRYLRTLFFGLHIQTDCNFLLSKFRARRTSSHMILVYFVYIIKKENIKLKIKPKIYVEKNHCQSTEQVTCCRELGRRAAFLAHASAEAVPVPRRGLTLGRPLVQLAPRVQALYHRRVA